VRASGNIPPAQLTPLIGRTREVAAAHEIGRPLRARSEEPGLLPQDPWLHRVCDLSVAGEKPEGYKDIQASRTLSSFGCEEWLI
jgi:hypothetical protein